MTKTVFAPPTGPGLKAGTAASFVKAAGSRSMKVQKPIRITVDLPPELHRRVKIEALNQGKPMTDLIREWIEVNCKP